VIAHAIATLTPEGCTACGQCHRYYMSGTTSLAITNPTQSGEEA